MYKQVEKLQENKNQPAAHAVSQRQSDRESTFQFIDNRPEAAAQQKLQEMASNSPQVQQLRAFQDMANNSHQTKQITQLQIMAYNHSPQLQQLIQKKEHNNSSLIDVNVQRKALNPAKGENSRVIQKYSYKADPAEITAKLPTGTQKWTESISAKVTWNKGEIMDPGSIGSHVVNNHGWFGLLKNQSNGNNATGLHVVNANWGGSANALEGNLVPGTPSLNGHHKSIENEVHNLFKNNGGTAPKKMSYEADVITPYPQTIDLTKNKSGDEIPFKDPSIKCTVTVGSETPVDNAEVALGGGTKIVVP